MPFTGEGAQQKSPNNLPVGEALSAALKKANVPLPILSAEVTDTDPVVTLQGGAQDEAQESPVGVEEILGACLLLFLLICCCIMPIGFYLLRSLAKKKQEDDDARA